jgi:hypothetical protein
VPEIVESYLRQASFAEEWLEGSLDEILRVDGRAPLLGEDQTAVLVKP